MSEKLSDTDQREEEPEILFNFHIAKSKLKKLKEKALTEDTSVKSILNKLVDDYIKIYGNGNPVYPLDNWVTASDMKISPAFGRPRPEWQEYIEKHVKDEEELEDMINQAQTIKSYAEKKLRYGTTNVIVR